MTSASKKKDSIIPTERSLYLMEIAKAVRDYNKKTKETAELLSDYEALSKVEKMVGDAAEISKKKVEIESTLSSDVFDSIQTLDNIVDQYNNGEFTYTVRGKDIKVKTKYRSLCGTDINKVSVPRLSNLADKFTFIRNENLPGFFPYATGIFPFKRTNEDPKRMFAGEGGPKRTNERFHFLSKDDDAKRLSTAFDSVTLYGEDPDKRPDIFGKIGEAGVSIATLDDMKVLYGGFDLTSPMTSVSMTINGPAPIILAMFMNTAISQKLKDNDFWDEKKRIEVMRAVRGTVQADILKEDQSPKHLYLLP